MNVQSARDARVAGLVRIGQLEVSGEGQAEVDAYFSPTFRFHGPDDASWTTRASRATSRRSAQPSTI
jgi:hypothetical protein